MALILKPRKVYTDRYGHTGSDFYTKIAKISDVSKTRQEVFFTVEVYLNKNASDRELYPVSVISFSMKGEDFYNWYSKPLIQNKGLDPYKQLYLYLRSVEPDTNDLVWGDWQPDEPINLSS